MKQLFPNSDDIYDRYLDLRNNEPYKKKREEYLRNYNRQDWKRSKDQNCKKRDANFGQFKSKMDAAMNVFINVLTERNSNVKIVPRYAQAGKVKTVSDKITSAFHRHFIKPWEDRFMDEVMIAFDMVFFGKGIEHWPTAGCVYTENIPVERVFPDSNAGMNTKKWAYVFIEKDFTVSELYSIIEDDSSDYDFDKTYLAEILEQVISYSRTQNGTESSKNINGDISSSTRDEVITLVYAYVKENFNKEKKVSLYVFPAERKEWRGQGSKPKLKYLLEETEYCECISNVVAVRAYQITRSYWKFNSFAQQIYLSTMLYDKAMSLVVRAAKRNLILYFKSDNPDTSKKLLNQTDDEVQVVNTGVEYMTTSQNSNTQEVVEVVRQIMIDTENNQNIAQSPGSQNVKGYAITAQEAQIRAQKSGEAESLNVKILMNLDLVLYKEIYRRAVSIGASEKLKKSLKAFKEELAGYNITEEEYDIDNLYFAPSFLNGGSQSTRIGNAQAVLQALMQSPTSPGQEQAQRDLVAALVGVDMVDDYIAEKMGVNPIISKVGSENEDLDNPNVNPGNIPVLPDDKHLEELPFHIDDYNKKLTTAGNIIKVALQVPNKFRQIMLLQSAADLIMGQDNKGGHIQAHIQAASNSEANADVLKPMIAQFMQLQAAQDQLTQQISQLNEKIDKGMQESDINNEELRHMQKKNQIVEAHLETVNNISTAKDIEKRASMNEQRKEKAEANTEKTITDLATQQAKAQQDLETKQKQNELKIQQQAAAKPTGT